MKIWELYPTIKNKAQRKLIRSALINAILALEELEGSVQRSALSKNSMCQSHGNKIGSRAGASVIRT